MWYRVMSFNTRCGWIDSCPRGVDWILPSTLVFVHWKHYTNRNLLCVCMAAFVFVFILFRLRITRGHTFTAIMVKNWDEWGSWTSCKRAKSNPSIVLFNITQTTSQSTSLTVLFPQACIYFLIVPVPVSINGFHARWETRWCFLPAITGNIEQMLLGLLVVVLKRAIYWLEQSKTSIPPQTQYCVEYTQTMRLTGNWN